ncbi:MAG: cytochrome b [Rhodobacteraceae bacterium]|uniref:cytochrome b n=1 Tax=Albidovulum sp. TaxID=1872424 RepID=UPI001D8E8712|nr:cytochrome b [uncultured Defluviimonas sp.]MCB2126684.1 cytochrome b [Paracoccaceae bacterium]MCC0069784.1 cytochrome b [Paracoccaceae bacterium]
MTRDADTAPDAARGFGRMTRVLHWAMAAGTLGTAGLGAYVARMEVGLGNLWLFGLHKTIGISLLALALLRIGWHRLAPPPGPLPGPPEWQMRLAHGTHRALYVLMCAVPVSGWAYGSATGIDTVIFGRVTVPPIAPVSPDWEAALVVLHRSLAWMFLALVALHVAGALERAVLRHDGTLRRMLAGAPGAGAGMVGPIPKAGDAGSGRSPPSNRN